MREAIIEILDQRVIVELPQAGGIGGYAVVGAREKTYLIGEVVKPDHQGHCTDEDHRGGLTVNLSLEHPVDGEKVIAYNRDGR